MCTHHSNPALTTCATPGPLTCSKLVHFVNNPNLDLSGRVHYVAHPSIGKRAVGLRLKGLIAVTDWMFALKGTSIS